MNKSGLPCPFSGCGSSDAFSWETEKRVGKCFSCESSYPHKGMVLESWAAQEYPLKDNYKMDDMVLKSQRVFPDTTPSDGLVYKEFRGISSLTMEFFGVKTNDLKQVYPYPNGTNKVRVLPKDFSRNAGFKADSLFGSNLFPVGCARKVTVCEGELDAMSAHQMLSGGGYINPVVSLPSASPNGKLWGNVSAYLDSFEQIILSVDNDDKGREVAEVLFDLFPDKVHIMDHGVHKDANDFLLAKAGKAYKNAWWSAKKYSPAGFTAGAEDWLKAVHEETPYEYTPTFSEALNEVTRGWVKGGITVVKAPPGTGKCLSAETEVLMYDGTSKRADQVVVGDVLMGDDSTPRNVLSLARGREEMFEVVPVKGDSWGCNKSHILSLQDRKGEVTDISVRDYLETGSTFKHLNKQYRTGVEVFGCDKELPLPAYSFGIYLADGSSSDNSVINLGLPKAEAKDFFKYEIEPLGYEVKEVWLQDSNCWRLGISHRSRTWGSNLFRNFDRSWVELYKVSSVEDRRAFLAGVLDGDGYYGTGTFEITAKQDFVADAIAFTARSLGMAAYTSIKTVEGYGDYKRVSISGDFTDLPLKRHKVKPRKQIKSVLRTGFSLISKGEGDYYGFEIDGNKRFLLGDFTVTHNTSVFRAAQHDLVVKKNMRVGVLHMEEMKSTTARGMATYHLGKNVNTQEDQDFFDVSNESLDIAISEVVEDNKFVAFEVNPQDPIEDTLKQAKYAVTVYGVDYLFIDHLQRLAYLSGVDGATAALTELGVRLVEFSKRRNVGIVCISHVNDDGKTKYAKSIEEEAIMLIELKRDMKAEGDDANYTDVEVTKNRPYSRLGEAGRLHYDPETTMVKGV